MYIASWTNDLPHCMIQNLTVFCDSAEPPASGGNSPATTDIAVGVVVGVVVLLLVATVIIFIVCYLILKSINSRSYKPDRFPSVDNSPSMSFDGTPDFASMVDTPDLTRKINGGHELKNLNGQFLTRSPFLPSGPMKMEEFAEHVEKFDSNRQLLFQEEYEVSLLIYLLSSSYNYDQERVGLIGYSSSLF